MHEMPQAENGSRVTPQEELSRGATFFGSSCSFLRRSFGAFWEGDFHTRRRVFRCCSPRASPPCRVLPWTAGGVVAKVSPWMPGSIASVRRLALVDLSKGTCDTQNNASRSRPCRRLPSRAPRCWLAWCSRKGWGMRLALPIFPFLVGRCSHRPLDGLPRWLSATCRHISPPVIRPTDRAVFIDG